MRLYLVMFLWVVVVMTCASSTRMNTIILTPSNSISITGDITEASADRFVMDITSRRESVRYIYIDSGGGSIEEGFRIIDAMRASGKKFTCIASHAASMAFSIFQRCSVRLVTPSATLMQHLGSYGIKAGTTKNNQSAINHVMKQMKALDMGDAKRMGLPLQEFSKMIDFDLYLFGRDAVVKNAADGIATVRCSRDLMEAKRVDTYDLSSYTLIETVSLCPLIKNAISTQRVLPSIK